MQQNPLLRQHWGGVREEMGILVLARLHGIVRDPPFMDNQDTLDTAQRTAGNTP